ncbi:MAG: DinB family protein [Caldilineaceae bacterium]|nr:DinB family protein [Caldilineaceae bacterium]
MASRIEGLLCDLSNEELRQSPAAKFNSLAWLLWHMARCEDVAVNTVIRNTAEVLDGDNWPGQLSVSTRHIGTGDTYAEMVALGRNIDIEALRAYRDAVGRETQAWAQTVDFATLNGFITVEDAHRAALRGAFGPHAQWVESLWADGKRTHAWILVWLAGGHNHSHIGEGYVIRGLLGHSVR